MAGYDYNQGLFFNLDRHMREAEEAYSNNDAYILAMALRYLVSDVCDATLRCYSFEKEPNLETKIEYVECTKALRNNDIDLLHTMRKIGNVAAHNKENLQTEDCRGAFYLFKEELERIKQNIADFDERIDKPKLRLPVSDKDKLYSDYVIRRYRFLGLVWFFIFVWCTHGCFLLIPLKSIFHFSNFIDLVVVLAIYVILSIIINPPKIAYNIAAHFHHHRTKFIGGSTINFSIKWEDLYRDESHIASLIEKIKGKK